MSKRNLQWFVLILSILVLGLAACGGRGGGATTSDGGQEVAQVPEAKPTSVGDPVAGKQQYDMVCIACHGPDGSGVQGLGKPFTTSDYTPSVSDEELLVFIKTGRPISDPLNTTGVDMPPKGGNPALTDEQILDIIAYIRTLHE